MIKYKRITRHLIFAYTIIALIYFAPATETAYALTPTPTREAMLREAGKFLGASCDTSKAFAFLATVPGGKRPGIAPRNGQPGIDANFACRLAEYIKAVRALGCNPRIASGYRSYAKQKAMCGKGKPGCAGAGSSCHQYGAAVDMVGASPTKGCGRANGKMAEKYGLIFGYSTRANVPADNRRRGKNHFQCIENRTSGISSGCNVRPCGKGTVPPSDPDSWDSNAYSNDPGPDPNHDSYPDNESAGNSNQDANDATVVGSPYDGQTPDAGSPGEGSGTDGPGSVNLDEEEHDRLFGDKSDSEKGNPDPSSDLDKQDDNDYDSGEYTERNTNTQRGSGATSSPTNQLKQKKERKTILGRLITEPPRDQIATKYFLSAILSRGEKRKLALAKFDNYQASIAGADDSATHILNNTPNDKDQPHGQPTPYVQQNYTYTPWYLKYKTRETPDAKRISRRLDEFFYRDLPPQKKYSWWQTVKCMFGFCN